MHQLEIRSLKDQNIQLLEERHYASAVQLMENAIQSANSQTNIHQQATLSLQAGRLQSANQRNNNNGLTNSQQMGDALGTQHIMQDLNAQAQFN